jgi:hypothetical protein
MSPTSFFSNHTIYELAKELFKNVPSGAREIGVHCYELSGNDTNQVSLFADEIARESSLVQTVDAINERYGERTVVSADTVNTGIYVSQKIPFGSTRYL